jgi:NTE family protein
MRCWRAFPSSSATPSRNGAGQATVVVTPDTRGIGLLEFHQIDRAVEAGRAAVDALNVRARRS